MWADTTEVRQADAEPPEGWPTAGRRMLWITLLLAAPLLAAGAGLRDPDPGPLLLMETQTVPDSLARRAAAMNAFAAGIRAELAEDYATALRHYEEAARAAPGDIEILTRQAACLFELRRPAEALPVSERAVARDSLYAEAQWVRGASLAAIGRIEEAVVPLRAATHLRPDRRALHMLVNVLEQLNRPEEMLRPLGALIEMVPAAVQLRERRARILLSLNRTAAALRDFQAILAAAPDYPGIHERVAKLLPLPDHLEARLAFYRALLEEHAGNDEFRWKLIRNLMEGERWDEAETELGVIRSHDPDAPLPLLQLALIEYRRGDVPAAFAKIATADSLAPSLPLVDLWKMRLHFAQQETDSVLACAERLLAARPRALEAHRLRTLALIDLDRWEEAVDSARRWAAVDPQDPQPWLLGASLLRDHGRSAEGLALMREAMQRVPDDGRLVVELMSFLQATGAAAEAETLLRDYQGSHPNDALVLNALGYTILERGGDLKESQSLLERAVEIDPDNPAILDSVGWLWYKKGDLGRAERWLRLALEKGARHPEIFGHLARVQADRGRLEDALETIAAGLAASPGAAALHDLRRDLTGGGDREMAPEGPGGGGNR